MSTPARRSEDFNCRRILLSDTVIREAVMSSSQCSDNILTTLFTYSDAHYAATRETVVDAYNAIVTLLLLGALRVGVATPVASHSRAILWRHLAAM